MEEEEGDVYTDLALTIVQWAGSGVIGAYAVGLTDHVRRLITRRTDGAVPPRDEAVFAARAAINTVYHGAIEFSDLPVREQLGSKRCRVVFRKSGVKYWAAWNPGDSKSTAAEVGREVS